MRNTSRTLAVLLSLFLGGCSTVYDMAGRGMVSYGERQMMPYFMASGDTEVVCAMGEGMSPVMMSFGNVVDEMVPILTLATGMCAVQKAEAEKLRYLKAMRRGDADEAKDARTMEKRYQSLAARRMLGGYEAAVRAYGDPGERCPKLKSYQDEFNWLIGLLVGMQSVMADMQADRHVGVPTNIAPKSIRGLQCLDSQKWWGVPAAAEAISQIILPTGDGTSKDPRHQLKHAVQVGNEQGVYLVHMLEAMLHATQGDKDRLKASIREHVAMKSADPGEPTLRFLNEAATDQMLMLSDRLWMEDAGQRTPFGKLGTFPDDPVVSAPSDAIDIDDLL